MQHKLAFFIEAGEKTCAAEPGKFCQHAAAKNFGTEPWCTLFQVTLSTIDGRPEGWLARRPECLKAAAAAGGPGSNQRKP